MLTCESSALMQRCLWLDWLRLLALFLVVICHCCDPLLFNPLAAPSAELSFWGAVWQSSTRACVPLFVCITGALLLPARESTFRFWKRRITRVLWPFLIWSALYCLFPWLFLGLGGAEPASMADHFVSAAAEPSGALSSALCDVARIPLSFSLYAVHMWYVYLLIGLYLFIPILSAWLERATPAEQYAVLGIWVFSLFIPYINLATPELWGVCAWNDCGMLHYFAGFSGYLLLGHLMRHGRRIGIGRALAAGLVLIALGYAVTLIGFRVVQTESYTAGNFGEMLSLALSPATPGTPYVPAHEVFLFFCSPNVALMVTGLLLIFREIQDSPLWLRRLLANLTSCGFGIYLVHYFFVGPAFSFCRDLGIPGELLVPAAALIVLPVTWCFVALLKRVVPGKWLLG